MARPRPETPRVPDPRNRPEDTARGSTPTPLLAPSPRVNVFRYFAVMLNVSVVALLIALGAKGEPYGLLGLATDSGRRGQRSAVRGMFHRGRYGRNSSGVSPLKPSACNGSDSLRTATASGVVYRHVVDATVSHADVAGLRTQPRKGPQGGSQLERPASYR